jgi:hypothetical protein
VQDQIVKTNYLGMADSTEERLTFVALPRALVVMVAAWTRLVPLVEIRNGQCLFGCGVLNSLNGPLPPVVNYKNTLGSAASAMFANSGYCS